MSKNLSRQYDGWIEEAKKLRVESCLSYRRISQILNVSEFRIACALDPNYKELRRSRINAWRSKNHVSFPSGGRKSPLRNQPSLPQLKCLQKPIPE